MNIIILLWDQKINTNTYNNDNSNHDDNNDNNDNNNNNNIDNNDNNNSNNDSNENKECRYVDWNITKIKIKVVFELIIYGVVTSRDWQWNYSMIWFFFDKLYFLYFFYLFIW